MNLIHPHSPLRERHLPLVVTFLFTVIYTSGLFIQPGLVQAATTPGGNIANPVVRAVDIAKPAVVRIITTIGGRLTVHFPSTPPATVTFPQDGTSYSLAFSGSGTLISPHGDILTADHVIKPQNDPTALDADLQQAAAQDVANYVNQNFTTNGVAYTQNDALSLLQSGYFPSSSKYLTPASEAYLSTDYTGSVNATDLKGMPTGTHAPIDNIEQESATNEKDVAIVHVNLDNTPFVQLDDSSNVSQQDDLTIIGFPGNGDVSDKDIPSTFLTSSVNKIYVSAIKQTDVGAPVIQVGGNVENGDSGGPALDSSGNIVGVVSFGVNASSPQGTSFLQASDSARDLLQSLNLNMKSGTFETTWREAFADYTSNAPDHWHKAHTEFQQLAKNFPLFQAVQPFVQYTNTQANHETVPQSGNTGSTGTVIAVVVVLFILALLVVALLLIMRRRRNAVPALVATPLYPEATGGRPSDPYQPGPALQVPNSTPPAMLAAQTGEPAWNPAQPSQPAPVAQGYAPAYNPQSAQPMTPVQRYGPAPTPPPSQPSQPMVPVQRYGPAPTPAPDQPQQPPAQRYGPAPAPAQPPQPPSQGYAPAYNPQPSQPAQRPSWEQPQQARSSQEYRAVPPQAQPPRPAPPAQEPGPANMSRPPVNAGEQGGGLSLDRAQSFPTLRPDDPYRTQGSYPTDAPTVRKDHTTYPANATALPGEQSDPLSDTSIKARSSEMNGNRGRPQE